MLNSWCGIKEGASGFEVCLDLKFVVPFKSFPPCVFGLGQGCLRSLVILARLVGILWVWTARLGNQLKKGGSVVCGREEG